MATASSTSGAHASAVCLVPTRTWRRAHHEYTVLGDGRDQTGFKRQPMTLKLKYSATTETWWIEATERDRGRLSPTTQWYAVFSCSVPDDVSVKFRLTSPHTRPFPLLEDTP